MEGRGIVKITLRIQVTDFLKTQLELTIVRPLTEVLFFQIAQIIK